MRRKQQKHIQPLPSLPPRRFFRTRVEVPELVRDGTLSHLDACALIWLHMFDWRNTGEVRIQVKELARWLNVRRETASRTLRHLADLHLIQIREDRSIRLSLLARDLTGSPPHPIGGGGISSFAENTHTRSLDDNPNSEYAKISPPPSLSSLETKTPPRDRDITQQGKHVTGKSHQCEEEDISPALDAVCAHIGVETPEGLHALARLRVGPRHLLLWHRLRSQQGSGIGSMIRLARKNPELARRRIQALSLPQPWFGKDFCPRCGTVWEGREYPPANCPECGVPLDLCDQCREILVTGEMCPYCKALPHDEETSNIPEEIPDRPTPEDNVWTAALHLLHEKLEAREHSLWIQNVRLLEHQGHSILLGVANEFTQEHLRKHLDTLIRQALAHVLNVDADTLEVDYVIDGRASQILM